ncbi:MAG: isoleucine--tRNA ligase [Alphaproteobacteria bacterium]|nr:isoleucine--tRNA ligase [Alphaproteobacteria bacterium]
MIQFEKSHILKEVVNFKKIIEYKRDMMTGKKYYQDQEAKVSFPKKEEEILNFWKENKIFEKSIEQREGSEEYVFYDGPPFANGLPHYGHLVTGYVKDIVPRFQTMRGHKVDRRFGWDCHGLPAELDAEKALGVSGHKNITEFGIDKFNDTCRTRVLKYTKEWENTVTRQARWVDFKNDYKTMQLPYMESLLWAFKQLYQKGLIYEGYQVLPYSWAIETPVSNFETKLDNSYRERTDTAVTVMFTLTPKEGETKPLKILVWTTTPWTLPSNLALAVRNDIDYSIYEEENACYVIGSAVVGKYKKELSHATKVKEIKGEELVGRTYTPFFSYFKDTPNCFRIIHADYVSTDEGTGTVHLAPGFGEDDRLACAKENIPVICPVDVKGCFTSEVPDYEGMQVFETNEPVIKYLKENRFLVKRENYKHEYPHCWRTDTPLIYRAMSSWFVKVTDVKDEMVKLNQNITWIPEHIKDGQFGKWLENARDWSISRHRFWGTPIPVWKSDDPKYPRVDVYGSCEELERDFGVEVKDLHRPFIDSLTRPNPDDPTGKSTMRRVEDVFDCWFESGSMSFAQIHYPFENKEWFESHFPADFIVEYVAQTRGWFYTMMVMATSLFHKNPFKTCLCHGVVLDENNQKLSKKLRNYPSPDEVFNTQGADALRWFLVSSPLLKGGNLAIDRNGKEIAKAARKALIPLWNAFYFFCLYANSEGIEGKMIEKSSDILDQYILFKLKGLGLSLTELLDKCDIVTACSETSDFLEILNNWYIRRSRTRFWNGEDTEAFNTLYTVLVTLTKLLAPLLPLMSEYIFKELTKKESVHLENWPDVSVFEDKTELAKKMDFVREICSLSKSVRETYKLRNRLPLKNLTVAGKNVSILKDFIPLLEEEVNVKEVSLEENIAKVAEPILYIKTPLVGKRLGPKLKDILKASKTNDWTILEDKTLSIAGEVLTKDEFEQRLVLKEDVHGAASSDNTFVITLDINTYPDLEEEGISRDFVRLVQSLRKEQDLDISDRILLSYESSSALVREALEKNKEYIKEQTLALEMKEEKVEMPLMEEQIDDESLKLFLKKA